MPGNGIDMEALSPRDANAQRSKPQELKKQVTNLKAAKGQKEAHPPPPPSYVTEPPCRDRREGAVYEIRSCLGKGGFAICYEGKLNGTSKRYALKIVKSQMPAKMEQKFQTELQIHSKMRQQNIVQFYRAFAFENSTYLVLELCPNGSLMDMVKRRKGLTEPEVRFYTVQITGAIKYMHSKGIIHRDLKMGNIFLDRHMNAKIGDFGLAALLVTGKDMHTIRRTTLCGTPNYIAPEILEKGRKGHDHMVDIWSLGIIVFAMLTSKPPFQSTTTDEIYRRAKERDYDWPEAPGKYISREAKDLVASMLQDANERPDPDQIVQDNFFICGYMPTQADITTRLRELPPDSPAFYERNTLAQIESNRRTLHDMCREVGVGPWNQVQLVTRQIWRECAEEEQHGLTPVIPLAKGIVYRPFDEVLSEMKLHREMRKAKQQSSSAASSSSPMDSVADQMDELSMNDNGGNAYASSSRAAPTNLGLLRAPPQSFAAQQRAQSKPATGTFRSQPSQPIAQPSSSRSAPVAQPTSSRSQQVAQPSSSRAQPSSSAAPGQEPGPVAKVITSLRARTRREPAASSAQNVEEQVAVVSSSRTRREAPVSSQRHAEPAATAAPSRTRSARAQSSASASAENRAPTSSQPAGEQGINDEDFDLQECRRGLQRPDDKWTIFSPDEYVDVIPGTQPDEVLQRLVRFQAEVERALNSRSQALLSSRDKTPTPPRIVVKWVDYSNKFGLGYILDDGSVGCVLKAMKLAEGDRRGTMPPACMLVHGAEQHTLRHKDKTYEDRHQIIPMNEAIYFYENHQEEGIKRTRVHPEAFRIPMNPDGTPGKFVAGKNIYEQRKRERLIVWKRFVNYMLGVCRDNCDELRTEDGTPTITDPSAVPSDIVTFYQRFGDVGCWMFCDGHIQFNFPDHTKVVLDPTATWCHFWHLTEPDAINLRLNGWLDNSALDNRTVLTYPLQTLLNFSVPPRQPLTSTRRRPEIPVQLRDIPEQNNFREKIKFIRDVVGEWIANGGLGNSDQSREGRKLWRGAREIGNGDPQKQVWVTIGARWGDQRVSCYMDPADWRVMGEEVRVGTERHPR